MFKQGRINNRRKSSSYKGAVSKIANNLIVSGLAKSVYYTLSKKDKDDKNKEIFFHHKERYRYRRITLELRNQGYNANHKKFID